jgi:hypothetical protein
VRRGGTKQSKRKVRRFCFRLPVESVKNDCGVARVSLEVIHELSIGVSYGFDAAKHERCQ